MNSNQLAVTLPYVSMKSHSIIIATFTECDEILTWSGSYITVQLNIQITMCCMQLHITFLFGIFLNFDILKFICGDRIICRRCEGSWSSTSSITTLYLEQKFRSNLHYCLSLFLITLTYCCVTVVISHWQVWPGDENNCHKTEALLSNRQLIA